MKANAYKCFIRERNVCTFTGFFGSKGIIKDEILVKTVDSDICQNSYETDMALQPGALYEALSGAEKGIGNAAKDTGKALEHLIG
uniref:Uncharacterized protein n=1 Tax=Romanomermis culicivorax TaxID=13658 RepID=A0A915L9D3_ROMCU